MRSVYYIIPTGAIGGAEKRFIELYCQLAKEGTEFDLHLVISQQLYTAIKNNSTIYDLVRPLESRLKIYGIDINQPTISFQKKLYRFVCAHTGKDDILHFILSFPTYIFPLKHPKTIYSLTESSLANVNIRGRILYLLNIFRSKYTDILDPVVYAKARKYFFYKKRRISMTPGSFTNTEVFKPADGFKKENWFVFLGRFFYVKQVTRLLRAIPGICKELDAAGHSGYKFIFLGYGQQEQEMHDIIEAEEFKDLPIEIKMTGTPEAVLAKSKVFFSVQLRNNYPSKSLLEGLAAGNIPLVTDVGTTRMIARPDFSFYVPEDFSANDIATQLISILSLNEDSLLHKMTSARNFVETNFTIKASVKYYTELYRKLQ